MHIHTHPLYFLSISDDITNKCISFEKITMVNKYERNQNSTIPYEDPVTSGNNNICIKSRMPAEAYTEETANTRSVTDLQFF